MSQDNALPEGYRDLVIRRVTLGNGTFQYHASIMIEGRECRAVKVLDALTYSEVDLDLLEAYIHREMAQSIWKFLDMPPAPMSVSNEARERGKAMCKRYLVEHNLTP
jgi:hypothetical protein